MQGSPAPTLGHRPALDVLRAIAVLMVIGLHFAGRARHLIPGAGLGVNVFFVLSGFLITRLLVEEIRRSDRIDLRAFMRRRSARLLPALVPLIAWILFAELVLNLYGDRTGVLRGVLATVFYVRNWLTVFGAGEPALGIAWSLAVEEQFYLLWPPVFAFVVGRRGLPAVARVSTVLLGVAVVQTAVRSAVFGASTSGLKYGTDTNGMICLMVGCVLALHLRVGPEASRRERTAWSVAALAGTLVLSGLVLLVEDGAALLPRGGWLAAALATAAIIGWAVRVLPARAGADQRILRWIGLHSYGLYLWHLPVFAVVLRWTPGLGDVGMRALALVATFLVAAVSMRFVEAPARRRFAGSSSSASASTGPTPVGSGAPLDVTESVDLRRDGEASADDGEVVVDQVEGIRPVG